MIDRDKTVGCALAVRGSWEGSLGMVAIDWVASRCAQLMELQLRALNVQSGRHKEALRGAARVAPTVIALTQKGGAGSGWGTRVHRASASAHRPARAHSSSSRANQSTNQPTNQPTKQSSV